MINLLTRAERYIERNSAKMLFQRSLLINGDRPLISFTFDDFPRTALLAGGAILKQYGVTGTYFTAFGLMGKDSPSGQIFIEADLARAVEDGHELGCHTYAHCHSWKTSTPAFEESIRQNDSALRHFLPDSRFSAFSYPLSEPRPLTKRATSRHFECCRAGGQTLNANRADLNQLSAFFLEQAKGRIGEVKSLIDRNAACKGWTIFATHDIAPMPSPYGCTPEFFEETVKYAVDSGARVLSVTNALHEIRNTVGRS